SHSSLFFSLFSTLPHQPRSTLFPYTTLFRSHNIITDLGDYMANTEGRYSEFGTICTQVKRAIRNDQIRGGMAGIYNPSITQRLKDRKSTRLNSSHVSISYAVFCLKKKKKKKH